MSEEKPKNKWRSILFQVGLFAAAVLAIHFWQTRNAASGPAPTLAATSVGGDALTLGGSNGPVLVHFWATWCGVCAAEQSTINSLSEDHRVISVASQSGGNDDVSRYMQENDVLFPAIADPTGSIAHEWGVSAFPTSFVVAEDGTIRNVEVGYTTSLGLRARLWLAR